MGSMELDQELDQNKKLIYTYWSNIPTKKALDEDQADISRQEVRSIITDVMRTGIEDDITKQFGLSRRHAFSAQELLDIVNDKVEKKVKISNIYFHLDKLMEIGLVDEITTIKEGRHKIRYFGRTAKVFLMDLHVNEKIDPYTKESLLNTLKILNPEISESYLEELLITCLKGRKKLTNWALDWFDSNHDKLKSEDIDFVKVIKTLNKFYFVDQTLFDKIKELADLFNFDPSKPNQS